MYSISMDSISNLCIFCDLVALFREYANNDFDLTHHTSTMEF